MYYIVLDKVQEGFTTNFFLKNIYLFIWLHQVLVAVRRIFSCNTWTLSCGMWESSSLTRDRTREYGVLATGPPVKAPQTLNGAYPRRQEEERTLNTSACTVWIFCLIFSFCNTHEFLFQHWTKKKAFKKCSSTYLSLLSIWFLHLLFFFFFSFWHYPSPAPFQFWPEVLWLP